MLDLIRQYAQSQGWDVDGRTLADAFYLAQFIKHGERPSPRQEDEPAIHRSVAGETGPVQRPDEPSNPGPLTRTGNAQPAPPLNIEKISPAQQDRVPLFTGQQGDENQIDHSVPFGALPTLKDPAAIRRALRSLQPRRPTPGTEIDEAATVEQQLEKQFPDFRPVMLRGSRRALRLSIVTEHAHGNTLWAQPISEFKTLLMKQGIFRRVRSWTLNTTNVSSSGTVACPLTHGNGHGTKASSLAFWPGEIVLVASDFISEGWWTAAELPHLIAAWAARQPLLLLNTLPPRLWPRTWTSLPDSSVSAGRELMPPVAMSRRLEGIPEGWGAEEPGLVLPIADLSAPSLKAWARTLMALPSARAPGIALSSRLGTELQGKSARTDPAQRVMAFRMASSRPARQLAQFLSLIAPLNIPVMRWTQQALLPDSDESHLAELVMGGLLNRLESENDDPEQQTYEFGDKVRPLLSQGLEIVQAHEILDRVGDFLEQRYGAGLELRTIVKTGTPDEIDALPSELRSFARVSRSFLERIGLFPKPSTGRTSSMEQQAVRVSRRLDAPLIDLRWSTTDERQLAILHPTGIEIWNALAENEGHRLSSASFSAPQFPVIDIAYWIPNASSTSQGDYFEWLVSEIAGELRLGGWQRLTLTRLYRLEEVERYRSDRGLLLAIDHVKSSLSSSEEISAPTINLTPHANRGPLSVALHFGKGPSLFTSANIRWDLSAFDSDGRPGMNDGELRIALSTLINEIRSRLGVWDRPGISDRQVTAIRWLDDGRIAVAESGHQGATLRALESATGLELVERAVDFRWMESVPSQWIIDFCLLETRPTKKSKRAAPTGVACLNADRSVNAMEGDLTRSTIGASSVRSLIDSTQSSHWGITTSDGRITIFRRADIKKKGVYELVNPSPSNDSTARDRILDAWIHRDYAYALTAQGWLHRGWIGVLGAGTPKLDIQPLRIGETVKFATHSPDGRWFVVLSAESTLQVWHADEYQPTAGWQVSLDQELSDPVVLGLALKGAHWSLAHGESLWIGDVPAPQIVPASKNASILWVDDRPKNNTRERERLRRMGLECDLSRSTEDALRKLSDHRYTVVITDMHREEGHDEGLTLIKAMNARNYNLPVILYAQASPKHLRAEAVAMGAIDTVESKEVGFYELVEGMHRKA